MIKHRHNSIILVQRVGATRLLYCFSPLNTIFRGKNTIIRENSQNIKEKDSNRRFVISINYPEEESQLFVDEKETTLLFFGTVEVEVTHPPQQVICVEWFGREECSVTRRPRKAFKSGESLKAFKMDILKRTIKVRKFCYEFCSAVLLLVNLFVSASE